MLLNSDSTVESQYSRDKCWLERKVCFIHGQQPGKKADSLSKNQLDHESFLMEKRKLNIWGGWGVISQSLHYLPLCADFLLIRCSEKQEFMLTLPLKLLCWNPSGHSGFLSTSCLNSLCGARQTLHFPHHNPVCHQVGFAVPGASEPQFGLGNNTTTCMNLKIIMLSKKEGSQRKKILEWFLKFLETKADKQFVWTGGKGGSRVRLERAGVREGIT